MPLFEPYPHIMGMLRRAAPTAAPANFTTPTVPRPAYRAPAGAPGRLPPAAPSPRSPWRAAQHIAAGAQQGAAAGQQGAAVGQQGAATGQQGAAAGQQGAAVGQQGAAVGQQGAAVGRQAAVAVQPWQAVCKGVLCYKGTGKTVISYIKQNEKESPFVQAAQSLEKGYHSNQHMFLVSAPSLGAAKAIGEMQAWHVCACGGKCII
jgi:hypothetical protein